MPLPALLLADNDGTIVDSEPLHFRTIGAVGRRNKAGMISHSSWWARCSGKGHAAIHRWFGERSARYTLSEEKFLDQCVKAYLKKISDLRAKPGIPHVFAMAARVGIPVGVVSNSPTELVEKGLIAAGLAGYVREVFGADRTVALGGRTKPHPDPWIIAARVMGFGEEDLKDAVALEDSASGCRSAFEAKIGMVVQIRNHPDFNNYLVPASPHAHAHVVSESELVEYFERRFEAA